MNLKSDKFALGVLLFLHFVLALAYAFDTPYRSPGRYFTNGGAIIPDVGAPDERQHANYVQHLLDGKGFPVLDPKDPNLGEDYQAHQPPLYYTLAAGVAKLTGQNDVSAKSAGLVLRALNCFIGATGVVGVFFLGYWGFKRREVALAGAAFASLLPMNLALSGAISNDPLLYCLCTWCLAVTALALREGWTMKRGIIIGVLLGLAFLTKTTALALAPAILVAAYLSGAQRPPFRVVLSAAGVALLLALPWWIRNQSLYGDPFAMKAFNESFVNSPTYASLHKALHWEFSTYLAKDFEFTWRSFVGIFGYMDIPLPDTIARVAAAVFGILALGGFLALRRPECKDARPAHILNGTFVVIIVLLFAGFNFKYFQGQARYLFPAIGPISIGFGLGLLYYSREKWKTSFITWVVMLTALNLYIISQFLPVEFAARAAPASGVASPGA